MIRTDLYAKFFLTVIAACLACLLYQVGALKDAAREDRRVKVDVEQVSGVDLFDPDAYLAEKAAESAKRKAAADELETLWKIAKPVAR